jgi:hypothetical protein
MAKKSLWAMGLVFLLLTLLSVSALGVPAIINYQGMLTDASGDTVVDGDYSIGFALYDVAAGATARRSETQTVTVSGGIYNVRLGEVTPLSASIFSGDLYLGVNVASDGEMTPRQQLTSVAYASKAADAATLEGYSATDFLVSSSPGTIETNTSGEALSVTNTGSGTGVYVKSGAGDGLHAQSKGTAIFGESPDHRGVHGKSDKDAGVYGESSFGIGVYGASPGGYAGYFKGDVHVAGKVGIGTTSLASKLTNSDTLASDGSESTDASGFNWRIFGAGYAVGIENTATGGNGLLVDAGNNAGVGAIIANFVSNDSSKLFVREDGRVGIGTTTPAANLDVAGDLYVQGEISRPVQTSWCAFPPCAFSVNGDSTDFYISDQIGG